MKAFLFAAGLGTRLGQLTVDKPKPLVEAAGRPLITYALEMLKAADVTDIMCNIHYKPQAIRSFFEANKNFNLNINFSYEEQILGTGGGLKLCEKFFAGDNFYIINSDIVSDLSLRALADKAAAVKTSSCIAVYSSPPSSATVSVKGELAVDFKNVLASGIKPTFDYMGAAFVSPEIFDYLIPKFSSIVYTGFTSLAAKEDLAFYEHKGLWIDAGTPQSLEKAREML